RPPPPRPHRTRRNRCDPDISRRTQLDGAVVPARRPAIGRRSRGNRRRFCRRRPACAGPTTASRRRGGPPPPVPAPTISRNCRTPRTMRQRTQVELTVNGETTEVAFASYKTLLEVLREDLGLCGTKHGCELG